MGETLRATPEEMTAILENAAVGILFTSERTIRVCNARAAQIHGDHAEMFGEQRHHIIAFPSCAFPAEHEMRGQDGSPGRCDRWSRHCRDYAEIRQPANNASAWVPLKPRSRTLLM